jgi:hypothetical protein
MKKEALVLFIYLGIVILSPFVTAQLYYGDASYQVRNAINFVLDIFRPFLELIIGEYWTSEFFFHKILVLILLTVICKFVLDKTPIGEYNKKVTFLIAAIVSILAIRFINENRFFEAIFIHYGVLGIAITTILPLVIFFYFVHNTQVKSFGRRMFWTIYMIILVVIWLMKSSEIPPAANWIYGLTILAALAFVFLDKNIHAYLGMSDFRKFERDTNKRTIRKLHKDFDELKEHFEKRRISWEDFKKERKEIRDRIAELSKE